MLFSTIRLIMAQYITTKCVWYVLELDFINVFTVVILVASIFEYMQIKYASQAMPRIHSRGCLSLNVILRGTLK